jgi:amidophosphoribosyltransferase
VARAPDIKERCEYSGVFIAQAAMIGRRGHGPTTERKEVVSTCPNDLEPLYSARFPVPKEHAVCGIIGIVAATNVNIEIYDALTVLQHRGQDAAGIATSDGSRVFLFKGNGLVKDVFRTRHMKDLAGAVGIGHVRYPTAGSSSPQEAQPMYVNSPHGITIAHNGNLTNATSLKEDLRRIDKRHLNTHSDSEILLNVVAHEISRVSQEDLTDTAIFKALERVHSRVQGAYAAVLMIPTVGLVAFRDPCGIRPLIFGRRGNPVTGHVDHMVASESVALDVLGFEVCRDVAPGETIIFRPGKEMCSATCASGKNHSPCIFELVYLARPDSIIDGISVYKSRLRMGDTLAKGILNHWPDHDIDVVIPVPDTSRSSAIQVAHHLGVKYREGFIKNRYIGRTFIMGEQAKRKKSVRQKLNPISLEFLDKNVLLVDDSIVRGTTCTQIIQMARDAGARRVYFASAAPPIRFPNVYGIDMPTAQELVAHGRSVEEVAREIGADRLFYQQLEDLIEAGSEGNRAITDFEDSVFSGSYPTGDITSEYLNALEEQRSNDAKVERLDSTPSEGEVTF